MNIRYLYVFILLAGCQAKSNFSDFKSGDIIFQTSKSSQSKAIQVATNSKYSHMGIVYKQNQDVFVYEAMQPVKLTPLKEWIKKGENSHFVLKRLKNSEELLTKDNIHKMMEVGKQYSGKDYDIYFEWSNDRIYCSELVWKIYKEVLGVEIGSLEKLEDLELANSLVKAKLTERYGDDAPMNELIISPVSMFESTELATVYSN